MNILDKMLTYCKTKDLQGKKLLLNFTHIHAKNSKINNYISIFVDNNEYVLEQQKRFYKDYYDHILNINEFYKWLKNMPKFDIVIGNPPYEGKGNPLYLRILEKVNEISKKVIWICPSQWVKNYKDSKFLINVKTETCSNLISHDFVGNPFENATLANEVGIFVFGEGKKENYNSIRFERFLNPSLAKSIIEKFENFKEHINKYDDTDNSKFKNGYYVNASKIRGHFINGKPIWDWTTLFGKDQRRNFKFIQSKEYNHWKFKTIDECKNFISACETDILMFAYYVCKQNVNCFPGYFVLIPWLGDYTHKWTEKEIQDKIGLTNEEVAYIHKEMKNFGWKAAPNKGNK